MLLADDEQLLRQSLLLLIDSDPRLVAVGEATDGQEAVAQTESLRPDVVLMDVRMPRMNGLDAMRHICQQPALNDTRILVLTTFDLDEYVYTALRLGASGFLLKNSTPAELLRAVHVIADGDALLAPEVTRRLLESFSSLPHSPRHAAGPVAALSHRERELLTLIAEGLSNTEIAERLVLSPATVKTYVSRLLTRLDARDRAQLVIAAYESGLVIPGYRGNTAHRREQSGC